MINFCSKATWFIRTIVNKAMKNDIKQTGKQFLNRAHVILMRKGIIFNPRRGSLEHEEFVYYLESSGKEIPDGEFPKLLSMYEQYRDEEIEEYLKRCKPKAKEQV